MTRFCTRLGRCILFTAAACSFFVSSRARAVTTSWNTNASGDFTTAANWTSSVPDSDDTAVFNRGFVAYEVNFPGGFIFDPPTYYPIQYLEVRTNEVSFVHNPAPFRSNPSLSVVEPGHSIVVGQNSGDVAILNMALISMSGSNASIGRAAGAEGTLNVGGTISLSGLLQIGEFGSGTMNVTGGATVANTSSLIGANLGSSGHVTVTGTNSQWINSYDLAVGNNDDGTLWILDGGSVSALNVDMGVGASGFGNADVTGAGSTWTISGHLHVGKLSYGFVEINNGGLVSSASATIGGGNDSQDYGAVRLGGFGGGGSWTTGQLSIGSGSLSLGRGNLFINTGAAVNVAQDVLLVPRGMLELNGGTLNAQSVSFQGGGEFLFKSGTLHVGVYNGDLTNIGGVLAPGHSPGISSFNGSYTQLNDATLQIELGGLTRGTSYDAVVANGQIALDGTLQVVLADGFMSAAGNSFDILDWGSLSGTFDTLDLEPLAGGLVWNTSQLYSNGVLSVAAPGVPGDYNGSGTVDAADYVLWRKGGPLMNEVDMPGIVNAADYTEWRARFGNPSPGNGAGAGANATVPESASIVLLLFAAVGICFWRRCKA